MIEIQNITDEAFQDHIIAFGDAEIEVSIRFFRVVEIWTISVTYNGKSVDGVKLSLGTLHVRNENWPFDFVVRDNSTAGIDPFKVNDFSDGRCSLYMFEAADMETIRGYPVG